MSPGIPQAGPVATRRSRWLLPLGMLSAGLWLLTACASTPEIRYFRVDYPLPGPSTDSPLPLTLGIARVTAPEPYRQERIIYRTSLYQVQYYPHDRWESSPADMINDRILEQFAASGRFRRVTPWRRGDGPNSRLETRLRRFEETDEGDGWYGLVELEYEVLDGNGRSLLREAVSRRVKTESRTVEGIVEALSQGLRAGVEEMVSKTAATLGAARP